MRNCRGDERCSCVLMQALEILLPKASFSSILYSQELEHVNPTTLANGLQRVTRDAQAQEKTEKFKKDQAFPVFTEVFFFYFQFL